MTNEEAIEILEERWRYSKTYKYTDAEIREAFDMAIEALKHSEKFQQKAEVVISQLRADRDRLEEAHRWVPVSERLPDTDEDVLVDDGSDRFVAWWVNDGIDAGWHSFDENYDPYSHILAWMPLPKPYTAESEES